LKTEKKVGGEIEKTIQTAPNMI